MSMTPEGVWVRAGFRRRLLAYDDVAEVTPRHVVSVFGDAFRLPADTLAAVREILDGPGTAASLPDAASHLRTYCNGPHAARVAARTLLQAAERASATDIHLEPGQRFTGVRMRRTGALEPFCEIESNAARRMVAALKGLAGCLPYRKDRVQEGRIPREGVCADIRASFVPTALGERVALRLFGRLRAIDELGMSAENAASLRALLSHPRGLVLVAGPSGSGKTTTLYAALGHLSSARAGGAHLSIEDPVEQRLRVAGIPVDQIELDPGRDRDGATVLAASLRQDVDVLSVGEIRTPAEARLAVEAAHTGRLVLAGIHAGSAREASERMHDLGVDPVRLQRCLVGTVYQRLETQPCTCPAGCDACAGTKRRQRLTAHIEGIRREAA